MCVYLLSYETRLLPRFFFLKRPALSLGMGSSNRSILVHASLKRGRILFPFYSWPNEAERYGIHASIGILILGLLQYGNNRHCAGLL